jgi:enoyl-CoA hydratase/carnithine racemase
MPFEDILFKQEKHIGFITLNRQNALNALTHDMILTLQQQLNAWEMDNEIHAIVIQANEGRAFCAGGDVRRLYQDGQASPITPMQFFQDEYRLNYFIHQLKKPYIALMDGITMGGGVGISLHGSHRIASERFSFAMPETSIGFFPDVGASYLLSRCSGAFGLYLGLTGERIHANIAFALDLVDAIVPAHAFPDLITDLLKTDLSKQAHQRVSICIQAYQTSINKEITLKQAYQDKINACFHQTTLHHVMHALKKDDSDWARAVKTTLLQKSPTSLAVTFLQLNRAQEKDLKTCFLTDHTLAYHFMHQHDFYEGVRALLIDKDKNPHWQPASFDTLEDTFIEHYFNTPHDQFFLGP